MNELFDYGRPASITLVALINRGGRQLPIAPQIVGLDLPIDVNQNLQLLQKHDGSLYLALQPSLNTDSLTTIRTDLHE